MKTGLDGIGSFQKEILAYLAAHVVWFDGQRIQAYEAVDRLLTGIWFRLPRRVVINGKKKRIGRSDIRGLLRRGILGEHYSFERDRFFLTPVSAPYVASLIRSRDRQMSLF